MQTLADAQQVTRAASSGRVGDRPWCADDRGGRCVVARLVEGGVAADADDHDGAGSS
jgi:hypothetical protein